MKGKCENCGKKLSVEEAENEKCLYCSQRRASIGVKERRRKNVKK